MTTLQFKRLSDKAILPTKAHATDSGFDLYAAEDVFIPDGGMAVVKTDVAVLLPPGYEAQIRPRSGVTSKTKLRVQLGTIDNGYTGNLGIIVDNASQSEEYEVKQGAKIAQLVVQALPDFGTSEWYDGDLAETERGDGGFGSTGYTSEEALGNDATD